MIKTIFKNSIFWWSDKSHEKKVIKKQNQKLKKKKEKEKEKRKER